MFSEQLMDFFLWNIIINMAILIWWFFFMTFAGEWVYKMHSKWIPLTKESFFNIHYSGIAIYKLFIFFFMAIPYIAMCIVN